MKTTKAADQKLGLDEALREKLSAAQIPPSPTGEKALLAKIRDTAFIRPRLHPFRRLMHCVWRELTALPLSYAFAGLGIALLSLFLAHRASPQTLFAQMFFLPCLPVLGGLSAAAAPRCRRFSELAATYVFDYRQLLLARLFLCAGYSFLVNAAVLAVLPCPSAQGMVLFAASLLLICAASLFLLRFRWSFLGAGILLTLWTSVSLFMQNILVREPSPSSAPFATSQLLLFLFLSVLCFWVQLRRTRRAIQKTEFWHFSAN